jgi:hypothetical protein
MLGLACGKKKDDDNDDDDQATAPTTGSVQIGNAALNLPLLSPPVKAATPAGLLSGSSLSLTLSSTDFQSRFFTEGPTAIFSILADIDSRIAGMNSRGSANKPACLSQAPVSYSIEAFGETIPFYVQCYEQLGATTDPADPKLVQFAVVDGVTYLYQAVGQSHAAAIVTPIAGTTAQYKVQVWMGVGYLNASSCGETGQFDGCSYGVIHIEANSSDQTFEMAVAGIGFGYCGAQLKSDGTNIYAKASADGESCEAPDTLCVSAANLGTVGECSAIDAFSLPALGRDEAEGEHVSAATLYPETPNVILTGAAGDSLDFGPTTPTAGAGDFTAP